MLFRRLGFLVLFSTALLAFGCVEGSNYATQNNSAKVAKHLLGKPPAKIQHTLDANFDEKIVLLGYDVDRDALAGGELVTVTWYWQCKAELGSGWRLFTHILDEHGTSRLNRDRAGVVRKNYQPEHWRPGVIVRDIQQIRISKDWDSKVVDIRTGVWKGADRLTGKGKDIDSSNRGVGPKLKVSEKKESAVVIPRARTTPEIDGEFEREDAWKRSVTLGKFSQTLSGKPAVQKSEVRLMWDDENLYIAMKAEDSRLMSEYTKQDDELWKADTFEIFLDPLGDKRHYYEIQVNPAGVVFDSYLVSHRKNDNDWTSNLVVKTVMDGTLNDELEDKGWSAELSIPFASMTQGGGVPPTSETMWSMNFFLVDKNEGKTKYGAWSPPLRGDFHALDRFGKISFQAPSPRELKKKTLPEAAKETKSKNTSPVDKSHKKSGGNEKQPSGKRSNKNEKSGN